MWLYQYQQGQEVLPHQRVLQYSELRLQQQIESISMLDFVIETLTTSFLNNISNPSSTLLRRVSFLNSSISWILVGVSSSADAVIVEFVPACGSGKFWAWNSAQWMKE